MTPADLVLIGGAHIDRIGRASSDARGTSAPGTVKTGFGGVARNVASGLAAFGLRPVLISAVGTDPDGNAVMADLTRRGVEAQAILRLDRRRTALYQAVVNHDGLLVGAVADMDIYQDLEPERLRSMSDLMTQASILFVDTNLEEKRSDGSRRCPAEAGWRPIRCRSPRRPD